MLHLYFVCHGETEKSETCAPHEIDLERKGRAQAREVAKRIHTDYQSQLDSQPRGQGALSTTFYTSPYVTTLQTAQIIHYHLQGDSVPPLSLGALHGNRHLHQVPEIREQDYGNTPKQHSVKRKRQHTRLGRFYYRYPTGESGADVYARVHAWIQAMMGAQRPGPRQQTTCNTAAIIVTHRLPLMVMLMSLYRWSPEELVSVSSVKRGSLYIVRCHTALGTPAYQFCGCLSDPLYRYIKVLVRLHPNGCADGDADGDANGDSDGDADANKRDRGWRRLHLKLRNQLLDPSCLGLTPEALEDLFAEQHPEIKREWIQQLKVLRPKILA